MFHRTTDSIDSEQLVRLLSDLRIENRQLCEEIGRLRRANNRLEDQLGNEIAVRFGRPQQCDLT